SS
ncbi:hypothetical protein CP8484711_2050, partial [Chlamydia psittaci 84-8471/1]